MQALFAVAQYFLALSCDHLPSCYVVFITTKTTSKKFNANKILIAGMSRSFKIPVYRVFKSDSMPAFLVVALLLFWSVSMKR